MQDTQIDFIFEKNAEIEFINPSFTIEDDLSNSGKDIIRKIERAGRTCYKSESNITDESAGRFIKAIIAHGHESVIEHHSVTVRFITDRGVTHEMVRHRLASYSQESTRYVKYNKKMQFIIPQSTLKDRSFAIFKKSCQAAANFYNAMLDDGSRPEQARAVLPNAIKTEIVMTANLREWRWFFIKRCEKDAHPDIRVLACGLLEDFHSLIPYVFDDLYDKFITVKD